MHVLYVHIEYSLVSYLQSVTADQLSVKLHYAAVIYEVYIRSSDIQCDFILLGASAGAGLVVFLFQNESRTVHRYVVSVNLFLACAHPHVAF